MQYYQVKPESDQVQHGIRFKTNFFIAHELYTGAEVQKSKHSKEFIDKHLEQVEISKKKTYFFFGARFKSTLNA